MITVIAEKPSVAKDLATYLGANSKKEGYFEGNNYCVTWAFGHLVEIKDLKKLGYSNKWQLSNLPFIPPNLELQVKDNPGIKKQFQIIKNLFDKSNSLICATDAGREGELIFRYIYELSNSNKSFKRLWISSLTEESIKEGFNSLKEGTFYNNLYNAAKARNQADYIVGINATIGMTVKASSMGLLSLGRVQTPVLALICRRYFENKNFISKPYFSAELLLYVLNKREFNGFFENTFEQKKEAQEVLNTIGVSLIVSDIINKEVKEEPPTLFDLTLLQRESNKRFGYTANHTLELAQILYEKHKILSYPRTSSKYLSDDMLSKIKGLFANISKYHSQKELLLELMDNPLSKRPINNAKVTDHHAIIPTEVQVDFSKLTKDEMNIYNLVTDRFLEAFMKPCIKDSTKVIFNTENGNFYSSGTVIKFKGWRGISIYEDEENEEEKQTLPELKIGQNVSVLKKEIVEKKTKAAPIHNESTLLQLMETAGKLVEDSELADAMKEGGLGTPATRASIIETLISRKFIFRDKKLLLPTELGLNLYDLVKDMTIAKPELTGEWEYKLALIEKGEYDYFMFSNEINLYTGTIIDAIKKMNINFSEKEIIKCHCEKGSIVDKGSFYKCNSKEGECNYPPISKIIAERKISEKEIITLITKGKTDILKGFKSKEKKDFDAALVFDKVTKKIKFDFTKEIIGKCPKCRSGDIEKNNMFYKCNKKECEFIIFKILAKKELDEKIIKDLITNKKTSLIKGFQSSKGKLFDSSISLDENLKIKFGVNKL